MKIPLHTFILIVAMLGCNKKPKYSKEMIAGASKSDFYVNLKKYYPGLSVSVDTAVKYVSEYTRRLEIDSIDCSSFSFNRVYIGEIKDVLFEVISNKPETHERHLISKDLKLWVCRLPAKIKAGNKILVSALVYNNTGFEKLFGLPAIVTSVEVK
jgi:hypothetical protein